MPMYTYVHSNYKKYLHFYAVDQKKEDHKMQ